MLSLSLPSGRVVQSSVCVFITAVPIACCHSARRPSKRLTLYHVECLHSSHNFCVIHESENGPLLWEHTFYY
jgi:hypothetical protein